MSLEVYKNGKKSHMTPVGDDGFKSGVEGFVDGIEPEETRVKTAEQSEI